MIKTLKKKATNIQERTHIKKNVGFALYAAPPALSNINFTVDPTKNKKSTATHLAEEKKQIPDPKKIKANLKMALKQQALAILTNFQSGIMIKGKATEQKKIMKGWLSIKKEDLSDVTLNKSKNELSALIFHIISKWNYSLDPKEIAAWAKNNSAWLWRIISPLKMQVEERMTVKPISTAGKRKLR